MWLLFCAITSMRNVQNMKPVQICLGFILYVSLTVLHLKTYRNLTLCDIEYHVIALLCYYVHEKCTKYVTWTNCTGFIYCKFLTVLHLLKNLQKFTTLWYWISCDCSFALLYPWEMFKICNLCKIAQVLYSVHFTLLNTFITYRTTLWYWISCDCSFAL